jgi:hypothetical protein
MTSNYKDSKMNQVLSQNSKLQCIPKRDVLAKVLKYVLFKKFSFITDKIERDKHFFPHF